MNRRHRFVGRIAGVGSTSGTRLVVGHWHDTPLGPFSDVMVERSDGRRVLLAPSDEVAAFVEATYTFDEVRIEPVQVTSEHSWTVRTPSLSAVLTPGTRTALGRLLRLVPTVVATSPTWCRLTDPVARVVLSGVRTRGTAGQGRQEYYGATDMHRVVAFGGTFDGVDLGTLRPVDPPCRFGFSSTPRRPSITAVTTTVSSG